jgi:hypothetical protein
MASAFRVHVLEMDIFKETHMGSGKFPQCFCALKNFAGSQLNVQYASAMSPAFINMKFCFNLLISIRPMYITF